MYSHDKSHTITIKIETFIDNLQFCSKHISCVQESFSETGACDKIMRNILYRQTGERLHYRRNASHGITVLDN